MVWHARTLPRLPHFGLLDAGATFLSLGARLLLLHREVSCTVKVLLRLYDFKGLVFRGVRGADGLITGRLDFHPDINYYSQLFQKSERLVVILGRVTRPSLQLLRRPRQVLLLYSG